MKVRPSVKKIWISMDNWP